MRGLLLAFSLIAATAAMPACAQSDTAKQGGPNTAVTESNKIVTEKVTLYGREFTLIPVEMEHPVIPWSQAKDYLPKDVLEAPKVPLTDAQILEKIGVLQATLTREYKKELEKSVKDYVAAHPQEQEYLVMMDTNDAFMANEGAKISPQIQSLANQMNALRYAYYMLSDSAASVAPVPFAKTPSQ
jgi:hypothetical protein